MGPLRFEVIDIESHGGTCVEFRRDAFACSFTDGAARFDVENGPEGVGYLNWLRERLAEFPDGCVHVWDGDRIVGQLEMRFAADGRGYINLFYLTADMRGSGAGDQLHAYAVDVLRRRAITGARLSANPKNTRAAAYYRKHGWADRGPRSADADVNVFELAIEERA